MGSSSQIFEYFMVCGLGPEIWRLHNAEEMYMPAFWTTTPGPVRTPAWVRSPDPAERRVFDLIQICDVGFAIQNLTIATAFAIYY
jgi:hypothetical protein